MNVDYEGRGKEQAKDGVDEVDACQEERSPTRGVARMRAGGAFVPPINAL